MDKPSICPEHGKEFIAECVECKKLLCEDCLVKKNGKYYCKQCSPSIEDKSKPQKEASKIGLILTISFSIILFIAGVYIFATNLLPIINKSLSTNINMSRLEGVEKALNNLKEDLGRYPTEEEGLKFLITDKPLEDKKAHKDWYGPYLPLGDKNVFNDNFGNPIYYGRLDNESFIQSFGKNGKRDYIPENPGDKPTGDDFVIWLNEDNGEEEQINEEEEDLEFGKPVVKGGWW
jgi:hypothetical protein